MWEHEECREDREDEGNEKECRRVGSDENDTTGLGWTDAREGPWP